MVVLACALAVGCGGQDPKGHPGPTAETPRAAPVTEGPGGLVEIGGGRSLYLTCVGSGSPAVVLEAGFGADTLAWRDVQPELGRSTRTCAYDRAGVGNSVAPPGVRDAIADLRRLLDRARIAPPYVLVGHSYGGVLARVFADLHPTETAGLVLIDTMGRDGRQRQLAIWPQSQAPEIRGQLATAVMGGVDLAAGEALASQVRTLGDMPLAVITAGRQDNFPRTPARLGRDLKRLWDRMQDELAGLSDNSVHVVALGSNHDIPRHTAASRPLSSAPSRPSSAPPATTRFFHRAGVCSAAPTFAARSSRDGRQPLYRSLLAAGYVRRAAQCTRSRRVSAAPSVAARMNALVQAWNRHCGLLARECCFARRMSRKLAQTAWVGRGGTSPPPFLVIDGVVPRERAGDEVLATVVPRLIDAPD